MPTFKVIALAHQVKADKTVRIKIRVTQNRQIKYIDCALVATIEDFYKPIKGQSELKFRSQSFVDAAEDIVRGYRKKCNDFPRAVEGMDCQQLVEFLTAAEVVEVPVDLDFIAYADSHILKLQANDRARTAQDYQTAINALQRFTGTSSVPVSLITVKFLQAFTAFIIANPINAKKGTTMSRAPSHYLGSVRSLHNLMREEFNDEETGKVLIPFSPFGKFKVPAPPATKKRAISPDMIRAIHSLPDEEVKNSTGCSRWNLAKDCFILSFCLLGMNSADLYDCKTIVKQSLQYDRKKTRVRRSDNARMEVDIQPEIKFLLDKYRDTTGVRVFNFYQHYATEGTFNAALNKGLKQVGTQLKIEDLEFYSARHSWATIALNDCGVDKYTVHAALNHVDDSMRVTDIYLVKSFRPINDANRKSIGLYF